MGGGASTTNTNDIFFANMLEARILDELRPAMTPVRQHLRWGPKGKSTAFKFAIMDDPGPTSSSLTEGTDFTSVTDITTSITSAATAAETGIMTTVSDVLIEVSLLDILPYVKNLLVRSGLEKWEADVAALMDDFSNVTTAASTLTPSDHLAAVSALEQRDIPGSFVAYYSPKQAGELRAEIAATTAIVTAAESGSVPKGPKNTQGQFGSLFQVPILQTSSVVTTSGLVGGAVFASQQALGAYELWPTRVETERRATLRGFYVMESACYGLVEVSDTRGQTVKSVA